MLPWELSNEPDDVRLCRRRPADCMFKTDRRPVRIGHQRSSGREKGSKLSHAFRPDPTGERRHHRACARTSSAEVVRSTARLTNNENDTWRVGAVAEGRIVRILANQGDVVKKNQLLAEMHSHDIHEARAEYKKAKAELARDKGVVEYARNQRDRAAPLRSESRIAGHP